MSDDKKFENPELVQVKPQAIAAMLTFAGLSEANQYETFATLLGALIVYAHHSGMSEKAVLEEIRLNWQGTTGQYDMARAVHKKNTGLGGINGLDTEQ